MKPFDALKQSLRNIQDVRRQAEINRLVTRAARRCVRDFAHAVASVEDDELRTRYDERCRMWKNVFWDTQAYRDSLHQEIELLERHISALEAQLHGREDEELPFLPTQPRTTNHV